MLAVATQAPVILAATKVLDVELRGWMIHDFPHDLGSAKRGGTDLQIVGSLVEENALELQTGADFGVAIIDAHHIAFADPILPGSIFKNGVHRKLHTTRTNESNREFSNSHARWP